jgi:hypothetical protein
MIASFPTIHFDRTRLMKATDRANWIGSCQHVISCDALISVADEYSFIAAMESFSLTPDRRRERSTHGALGAEKT